MSLKALRTYACQVAEIAGTDFGVINETGIVLVCSNKDEEGNDRAAAVEAMSVSECSYCRFGDVSYYKVPVSGKTDLFIFLRSKNQSSKKILELAAINIQNIMLSRDEKLDKAGFLNAILADKIPADDVFALAKKLQLDPSAKWIVFLIKTKKEAISGTGEMIRNLFPDRNRNIISEHEGNTVLVRQVRAKENAGNFEENAKSIVDTLNTELMVNAKVSIGAVANDFGEIKRSFAEAKTAQRIGSIFENEKTVVNYEKLGLGRLIYDLPASSSKLFVREVFKKNDLESLGNETLITIQKLFENNLNISETARLLYIHRNTLIYRLEKIKKATGLDLREFDDAVAFKTALLVKRNLDKDDALNNNI
ncbi:MAG: helix-turn-helix domain-containing protein [Eubacteriales bacterium]|nr:helix-turn-helix domain-containing protein [Eubacteriales bacterium]